MYQPVFPLIDSGREGKYTSFGQAYKSLKQDLLFLLYCSPGEWPGRPDLGVGLKHMLFENNTSPKWHELKKRILDQTARYLPAIKIYDVQLIQSPEDIDNNYTKIRILYNIDSLGVFAKVLEATTPGDQFDAIANPDAPSTDKARRT